MKRVETFDMSAAIAENSRIMSANDMRYLKVTRADGPFRLSLNGGEYVTVREGFGLDADPCTVLGDVRVALDADAVVNGGEIEIVLSDTVRVDFLGRSASASNAPAHLIVPGQHPTGAVAGAGVDTVSGMFGAQRGFNGIAQHDLLAWTGFIWQLAKEGAQLRAQADAVANERGIVEYPFAPLPLTAILSTAPAGKTRRQSDVSFVLRDRVEFMLNANGGTARAEWGIGNFENVAGFINLGGQGLTIAARSDLGANLHAVLYGFASGDTHLEALDLGVPHSDGIERDVELEGDYTSGVRVKIDGNVVATLNPQSYAGLNPGAVPAVNRHFVPLVLTARSNADLVATSSVRYLLGEGLRIERGGA